MKVDIHGNVGTQYNAETIYINAVADKILEKKPAIKDRLSVFLSYAHKDEDIKKRLEAHLAALRQEGKIDSWSDRQLIPGEKWDAAIKQKLAEADIVLLLISASFIASKYIWEQELSLAMERRESGLTTVIPIFGRACDFSTLPFAALQGLPKDAAWIGTPENDAALAEVAIGLRVVVARLRGETIK